MVDQSSDELRGGQQLLFGDPFVRLVGLSDVAGSDHDRGNAGHGVEQSGFRAEGDLARMVVAGEIAA